jgi:F-type H+-transporting ATPase subunit epsilon
MANYFKLMIYTPERTFFEGEAEALTVTTVDGQFTFLAGHVPIVMPVVIGPLTVKTAQGETMEVFSSEGFLEVDHEGVQVFVQACETAEEIDQNRAEEAKRRAEERLRQQRSIRELQQSKLAMARAMERLRVKKHRLK